MSTIVRPSSTRDCGTIASPCPRADCATNDSAVTDAWARGRGRLARALLLAWAGHGPEPEGGSWPAFYEYDLVSALALRELDFSPEPDGAPLDVALTYGPVEGSDAPHEAFAGESHDLPRALRRFTWPTVVVSGRRDMTTPPEVARRAAAGLPHGVLVTIDGGHSVETSMGLTPLEGLVMGTRSGDLDPSVLLVLARREEMTPGELDTLLNKRSGLLGLAGVSDMRDIEQRREAGDGGAMLAYRRRIS